MWDINTIRGLEIKRLKEQIEDAEGAERKQLEKLLLDLTQN